MTEEELRRVFERIAARDSFGFKRSRRGTYVNPARARDWRMFKAGAQALGYKDETDQCRPTVSDAHNY